MTSNWIDIKWIFEPDGALRDIYILNANSTDWSTHIIYLNENYKIKYGPTGNNKIVNTIDLDEALKLITDKDQKIERKTASILIDEIIINTHFFYDQEIEFDLDPKEINSPTTYEKLLFFMKNVSKILNKEVLLTGENQVQFPLITVDYASNQIKTISKIEAQKLWDNQ